MQCKTYKNDYNYWYAGFSISILMLIYFIVVWAMGRVVAGWTSIVISLWGIGGIILLSLGIIGEYIGKIYMEVKERPRFIIEKVLYEASPCQNKQ